VADQKKPNTDWFVYILNCGDGSLYTGITTDLQRRLDEHNDSKLGARYTRARRPVELLWFEQHDSRSDAAIREAEIKKLDRQQKIGVIENGWKKRKTKLEKAGAVYSI
jgi:putative endonuclease